MMSKLRTAGTAAAALLVLTACVDPAYQAGGERERAGTGAVVGAGLGALVGLTQGDDGNDRVRNAAAGAVIGGVVGAGIGSILDAQARELRGSLSDEVVVENLGDRLLVRMPQDILFAVDSAEVRPGLRSDLFALADSLRRYPESVVQIVGHTDSTASAEYNLDLSQRRANSVRRVLVNAGVTGGRVSAIGVGEDQPVASNLTPQGRALNRRVDIFIIPN